ncbi:YggS family pyridoxal phosphate-dependent enzyme [Candidatus Erwinia haradaeae]|uniref:Pyridoxal phosphate homeostasis protein n=1 Tax=Candidatus Erwinia haradaeae TaxID=1922217 RepID=A0A451D508_9GAMM|nr:YggS family pyridoxal phosphate-dependent enzyme [Candidatus Erwinia haradaeae]VFP80756.1 Pyridoxal phosphate homeostasis protein [Candidatus Erwinia haradaeae]
MIKNNIKNIRQRILLATERCQRDPTEVSVLAVSKTKTTTDIKQAIAAGQDFFGENYIQEGVKKIQFLDNPSLTWHFIGSVQSNKIRLVAKYFDWCQSVNSVNCANRLNYQRISFQKPLNILIQININNEPTKSGVSLKELLVLAEHISQLPYLKLRGLMAIPALKETYCRQLKIYQKMSEAFQELQNVYTSVDTLSLGTSHDMEAAIIAGSTMVRIGSAIFGSRGQE